MSVMDSNEKLLALLAEKATRLRIDSIRATTAAGSGHPTSCASAAEIMSVLFFSVMRYDPADPRNPRNDKFVLSKGHAAPILYAAWAEAGAFPIEHLTTLRRLDSDLPCPGSPIYPRQRKALRAVMFLQRRSFNRHTLLEARKSQPQGLRRRTGGARQK